MNLSSSREVPVQIIIFIPLFLLYLVYSKFENKTYMRLCNLNNRGRDIEGWYSPYNYPILCDNLQISILSGSSLTNSACSNYTLKHMTVGLYKLV